MTDREAIELYRREVARVTASREAAQEAVDQALHEAETMMALASEESRERAKGGRPKKRKGPPIHIESQGEREMRFTKHGVRWM